MTTHSQPHNEIGGFLTTDEANLNRLKRLLSFKYEPASIWQELLQNAEDAGARELHFAVFPGSPGAKHPFLRNPLLCALNDGTFSSGNARGIASLDLGTKGTDDDSIGKFGLGMKSVFNLGETLFYFASANQAASLDAKTNAPDGYFRAGLNPYGKKKTPASWGLDDGRKSGPMLHEMLRLVRAQTFTTKLENSPDGRWFALLLPLRHKDLFDEFEPLVANFPNPESLFPEDLQERLIALFPMLRSLQSVSVWRETDTKEPWFKVEALQEKGKEPRRPRKPSLLVECLGKSQPFGGTLLISNETRRFEGLEILLDIENFSDTGILQGAQHLYSQAEDEQTAQLRREKFVPHGAVAWLQGPPDQLKVRPAVWLPLPEQGDFNNGKSDAQTLSASGAVGLQLTLHGNFFIDDGRRNLVLNASNRDGELPQSKWNKRLLRDATLPLVLPALRDFLASLQGREKPTDVQIRELTRALCGAKWFIEEWRESLTQSGDWLFKLSGMPKPDMTVSVLKRKAIEKSTGVGAWTLEKAREFWLLPAPPEGSEAGALDNPALKVFEWFPALNVEVQRRVVAFDWPRMAQQDAQSWSEGQIIALLKGCKGGIIFGSVIATRYFLTALKSFGTEPFSEAVWMALVRIGHEGLRDFSFGARLKDDIVPLWREFWALIPRRFWLPFEIGIGETSGENRRAFLTALLKLGLERTPVPLELAPEGRALAEEDEGKWNTGDARKVAIWFANLLSRPNDPLSDVVRSLNLIEATGGTSDDKFTAFGDLKLWKTREWRDADNPRTGVLRSWAELLTLREEDRLWRDARDGGADWLRSWCRAVQVESTGGGDDTFVVSIEEGATQPVSKALWPTRREQLETFGAAACLQLLRKTPPLRDLAGRAALVPRLFDALKADSTPANRMAVRFLLHGEREHFHDTQTALWKADPGARIWHQLALSALPVEKQWTIIDGALSSRISDDIAEPLSVTTLGKTGALEILRENQTCLGSLRWNFEPRERGEILRDLTDNPRDEELWRALPFHNLLSETGVRIGALPPKCFLEGAQIPVPDALKSAQTLVSRPVDGKLRSVYDMFGVREWDVQSLLELALEQFQPARFCATILQALPQLPWDDLRDDLEEDLKTKPWIAVGEYAYAPSQIVHLPSVQHYIASILEVEPQMGVSSRQVEGEWGKSSGWIIAGSELKPVL